MRILLIPRDRGKCFKAAPGFRSCLAPTPAPFRSAKERIFRGAKGDYNDRTIASMDSTASSPRLSRYGSWPSRRWRTRQLPSYRSERGKRDGKSPAGRSRRLRRPTCPQTRAASTAHRLSIRAGLVRLFDAHPMPLRVESKTSFFRLGIVVEQRFFLATRVMHGPSRHTAPASMDSMTISSSHESPTMLSSVFSFHLAVRPA